MTGCVPVGPGIPIPRLSNIIIDGNAADWSSNGYRVEIFSDNAGELASPTSAAAKMRLAWDARGILVLLDVHDDHFVESADPNDLAAGDCVTFYIYAQEQGLAAWEA